jgi:hypothetical protein
VFDHELKEEFRSLKEAILSALDDLTTAVTALFNEVQTAVTAIEAGTGSTSSVTDADAEGFVTELNGLTSQLTAALAGAQGAQGAQGTTTTTTTADEPPPAPAV